MDAPPPRHDPSHQPHPSSGSSATLETFAAASRAGAERILICDDSETIRLLAVSLLEPRYRCVAVASAEEALQAIARLPPDLILSDVQMAGMSGLELCQRTRAHPATADVPFILMTGVAARDRREEGLEAGADDLLYKPIRPRELLVRVQSLLKLRAANRALLARTRELEESNRMLQHAQAALVQSDKLAMIGTLAAGVAHEINNPLAYVKAGIGAILEFHDELEQAAAAGAGVVPGAQGTVFDELRQIGDEVQDGVQRIERIVRDLRDFAADRREEPDQLDLRAELLRAWRMAAVRARTSVGFELDCDHPVPVRAVRRQIGQVFLNVLLNAVQAVEGRMGKVRASIRRADGYAEVRIADNGPGIPAAILPRVFEPFFSTKPPGQGTGLGLSVSFGIVTRLGGSIIAASPEGEGAVFVIRLPVLDESASH